jgi:TPR repeat protein
MYQLGDGFPQDYDIAAKWFKKSAHQGHTTAQARLGLLYSEGLGVPQDFSECYIWASLSEANKNKPKTLIGLLKTIGLLRATFFETSLSDKCAKKLTSKQLSLAQEQVTAFASHAYDSVFYCLYQNDNCVKSSAATKLTKAKVLALVTKVKEHKKNFIGFIDESHTTLQFYLDDENKVWVEIPSPQKNGAYGKHIDVNKMQKIISDLKPPYSEYKKTLNLKYKAW